MIRTVLSTERYTVPSHARRSVVALAVAFLLSVSLTAMIAPSAHAVCWATTRWTSTNPTLSTDWEIRSDSTCDDLFAAYTFDHNDYVRGWYLNGSTWTAGTAGWEWVTTANDGWETLISSILNGTTVRGEGSQHSQYVRYVQ